MKLNPLCSRIHFKALLWHVHCKDLFTIQVFEMRKAFSCFLEFNNKTKTILYYAIQFCIIFGLSINLNISCRSVIFKFDSFVIWLVFFIFTHQFPTAKVFNSYVPQGTQRAFGYRLSIAKVTRLVIRLVDYFDFGIGR